MRLLTAPHTSNNLHAKHQTTHTHRTDCSTRTSFQFLVALGPRSSDWQIAVLSQRRAIATTATACDGLDLLCEGFFGEHGQYEVQLCVQHVVSKFEVDTVQTSGFSAILRSSSIRPDTAPRYALSVPDPLQDSSHRSHIPRTSVPTASMMSTPVPLPYHESKLF